MDLSGKSSYNSIRFRKYWTPRNTIKWWKISCTDSLNRYSEYRITHITSPFRQTLGSDSSKYLNEFTVSSFEAMQLSINLRTELKVKILSFIQEGNASIKVI